MLVPSPVVMVSLMQTFWIVSLVLVDWSSCPVFLSLSSPAPASAASEFIRPKYTSVYNSSAVSILTTSNRFAPISSTAPLMEGSLLEDHLLLDRRLLNVLTPHHSISVILFGSRPVASSSRTSVSSSQVVAGAGAQPCSPASPFSVSPSPTLPECSKSSIVAAPLDSISGSINQSHSPLPVPQALVAVGPAVGNTLVSAPSAVPTVPSSQGSPSLSPGFWEQPPPTAHTPQSSTMLVDISYSPGSLSSGYSLPGSLPPRRIGPFSTYIYITVLLLQWNCRGVYCNYEELLQLP